MRMMNTQKGANRRKPQARSCAQPPAPGSAIERSTAGTKPLRKLFGGGFQCPPPRRKDPPRESTAGSPPRRRPRAQRRTPLPAPMPIRQPSSVSAFSLPVSMNGTWGGGNTAKTARSASRERNVRDAEARSPPAAQERNARPEHAAGGAAQAAGGGSLCLGGELRALGSNRTAAGTQQPLSPHPPLFFLISHTNVREVQPGTSECSALTALFLKLRKMGCATP